MNQNYNLYTTEDHLVWKTLYTRQMVRVNKYASNAVIKGMEACGFEAEKIPNFETVNIKLLNTNTTTQVIEVFIFDVNGKYNTVLSVLVSFGFNTNPYFFI